MYLEYLGWLFLNISQPELIVVVHPCRRRSVANQRITKINLPPGISLNGRSMVSSLSGAYRLCGVAGFHGSTSPSIMASLSAPMVNDPNTFTAVTLGSDGTTKCSPPG